MMEDLKLLYDTVEGMKKLGLPLTNEIKARLKEVEEQIINDELIPQLTEVVSPILENILRPLLLIVEHIPGEEVSIRITEKKKITVTTSSEVGGGRTPVQGGQIAAHSKGSKKVLRVTFPDGKVISHYFAYDTLLESIRKIGVEKVRKLGIYCNGVPLISEREDDYYNTHELTRGIYVMTHSSTRSKKAQLDQISEALGISLKVEIV